MNPSKAEVWDRLSAINVSEHVEEKMGLSYLSWAWAWTLMKEFYPEFTVEWHGSEGYPDLRYLKDGSAMVGCTVSIGEHVSESVWLPVMDNRNKAINNPSARDVSDAKMRCLVKAFALMGLGVNLYAGEDLPKASVVDPKEQVIADLITSLKGEVRRAASIEVEFSEKDKSAIKQAIKDRDQGKLEKALKLVDKLTSPKEEK